MTEKAITPKQLKMVHTLLSQTGLMDWKAEIIHSFSGGRTTSSRELTATEAKNLINRLLENEERNKLVKRIWHVAYEVGMIFRGNEDMRINAGKINLFCKTNGTVKKPIECQDMAELKRTHRQFEAIHRQYKAKQAKEQHIAVLREYINIFAAMEDYEACIILKGELDSLTHKQRRQKNERIPTKR